MTDLRLRVNAKEIAERVAADSEVVFARILEEMEKLVTSTHGHIIQTAQKELKGWQLQHFLGEKGQNVTIDPIAKGIWVVEVSESVSWLEKGRPATSQATSDWLLKPGKTKQAKDGSFYRVIPMTQGKVTQKGVKSKDPVFAQLIQDELKRQKISLRKIERHEDGRPKVGILRNLKIPIPGKTTIDPFKPGGRGASNFFSKSRSPAEAREVGLKPYKGKFHLEDAVLTQFTSKTKGGKERVHRQVVTFRTVSSKHQAEGRWLYPATPGINSIEKAHGYAVGQWEKIQKELEQEFNS